MRRHKAFCSYAQRIIHKVNHWHLFKDFYKKVFQGEHTGHSLRPWEGLLSEAYLWGKCLRQRSLLNLGLEWVSEVAQSCPTLSDPIDCSLPGSSIHGISQARILEWVAIFFSRGSSRPRIEPTSSTLAGGFFTAEPPGRPKLQFQYHLF